MVKATYRCRCCGEEIYFDELYYDVMGEIFCVCCVEGFRRSAPEPWNA